MKELTFTVDAKLLRELGERLVGRPHIALGELIKNSFDADARQVEITFDGNSILLVDDGHGMNERAFTDRWMRIGTTIKAGQRVSPALERTLTGSKGVGRLSAQLLGTHLTLQSSALVDPAALGTDRARVSPEIVARIDWPTALLEKDLTDVAVEFETNAAPGVYARGSRHGTSILLSGLTSRWEEAQFESLAREIWALQPPSELSVPESAAFKIVLNTPFPEIQGRFDSQMNALMDIASARISGRLIDLDEPVPEHVESIELSDKRASVDEDGPVPDDGARLAQDDEHARDASDRVAIVEVTLFGQPSQQYAVKIPHCEIDKFDFEIRVFDLVNRQPRGIRVDTARRYLSEFGGVHLYDDGFRLPYYGPDSDWLRLELDHARRLSRSQLLPDELQVRNAMQDLPSNKRVFGFVSVSTSHEARTALARNGRDASALSIQITRDRMKQSTAFDQLTQAVRLSIDLYALARAKSKIRRGLTSRRTPRLQVSGVVRKATEALEAVASDIPEHALHTIRDSLDTVTREVATREQESRAYASLLGSLATAGMTSLAYEHEVSRQRAEVEEVARLLRTVAQAKKGETGQTLDQLSGRLSVWGQRSDRIRALFRPLLDEESRTHVGRYRAKKVATDVVRTLEVLARRTQVDCGDISPDLLLPSGTWTAWSAVFQNLLMNAFRATLDSSPALVKIDGAPTAHGGRLRIQDNGSGGVEISSAERLFLPFERQADISEKAEALGMGGSGLGLTIVKMILDEMNCEVTFTEPSPGWSTSITIEWKGA